jgi:hypothetical protein
MGLAKTKKNIYFFILNVIILFFAANTAGSLYARFRGYIPIVSCQPRG